MTLQLNINISVHVHVGCYGSNTLQCLSETGITISKINEAPDVGQSIPTVSWWITFPFHSPYIPFLPLPLIFMCTLELQWKTPPMKWDNPSGPSYVTCCHLWSLYGETWPDISAVPLSTVVISPLCYCGNPGVITMPSAIYPMELEKHGRLQSIYNVTLPVNSSISTILLYFLLTAVLYMLTYQSVLLPCQSALIRGTVLTAATSLLDFTSRCRMSSQGGMQHWNVSKCRAVMHKPAITM